MTTGTTGHGVRRLDRARPCVRRCDSEPRTLEQWTVIEAVADVHSAVRKTFISNVRIGQVYSDADLIGAGLRDLHPTGISRHELDCEAKPLCRLDGVVIIWAKCLEELVTIRPKVDRAVGHTPIDVDEKVPRTAEPMKLGDASPSSTSNPNPISH